MCERVRMGVNAHRLPADVRTWNRPVVSGVGRVPVAAVQEEGCWRSVRAA